MQEPLFTERHEAMPEHPLDEDEEAPAPVWLQRMSLIVLVLFCLYIGALADGAAVVAAVLGPECVAAGASGSVRGGEGGVGAGRAVRGGAAGYLDWRERGDALS